VSKTKLLDNKIKELNLKGAKKSKLSKFMQQQSEKYSIPMKTNDGVESKTSLF
jgi:hypothetical protein